MTPPRTETLLLLDDQPDYLDSISTILAREGFAVLCAPGVAEARQLLEDNFVDLLLLDERLDPDRTTGTRFLADLRRTAYPDLPAIVLSAHADLDMAQKAMRAGASDVLSKLASNRELLDSIHRTLEQSTLLRQARLHRWYSLRTADFPEIIGDSPAIRKVKETIRAVAPSKTTVLIEGESGTGKELIAHAIHSASPRRGHAFEVENFGSMNANLVESKLFGVVRGAYTDARRDVPGLFELAHTGTLFLDEIGEAPLDLQVRLLRVLEEQKVTRLGDTKSRDVDVRLIAATNRDLLAEVEAGRFRKDLYFRLKVVKIVVPPLRDRTDDVQPIASHLLAKFAGSKRIPGFDRDALEKMRRYPWPGNVRELRNVIENAVIHTPAGPITAEALVLERDGAFGAGFDEILELDYSSAEFEFEKRYFTRLLQRAGGNKTRAAELAKMDRAGLYKNHLKKLGLGGSGDDQ